MILNHHTSHAICNMPIGGGQYQQMVRKMPGQIWSKWRDVPARCWGWLNNHAYFGSVDGKIYLGGSEYLTDNGAPIDADVRFAWSSYKSVNKKNFKMIRLYSLTDGQPRPFMDLEVDYNNVVADQPAGNHHRALGRGRLGHRDMGREFLDAKQPAETELAGRHRAWARRRGPRPRQRFRLHVLADRR